MVDLEGAAGGTQQQEGAGLEVPLGWHRGLGAASPFLLPRGTRLSLAPAEGDRLPLSRPAAPSPSSAAQARAAGDLLVPRSCFLTSSGVDERQQQQRMGMFILKKTIPEKNRA